VRFDEEAISERQNDDEIKSQLCGSCDYVERLCDGARRNECLAEPRSRAANAPTIVARNGET